MWVKTETERLRYIKTHQNELRAAQYFQLQDAIMNDADNVDVGQRVILPSTFIGGPRHMNQYMQDAMALVRAFSRPSLFITITCNPQWPEITEEPFAGQSYTDRHVIVSRVLHLKVRQLLKVIFKEQVFDPTRAFTYSIEWQKRGLPHIHLLIWFETPIHPEQIDSIIKV